MVVGSPVTLQWMSSRLTTKERYATSTDCFTPVSGNQVEFAHRCVAGAEPSLRMSLLLRDDDGADGSRDRLVWSMEVELMPLLLYPNQSLRRWFSFRRGADSGLLLVLTFEEEEEGELLSPPDSAMLEASSPLTVLQQPMGSPAGRALREGAAAAASASASTASTASHSVPLPLPATAAAIATPAESEAPESEELRTASPSSDRQQNKSDEAMEGAKAESATTGPAMPEPREGWDEEVKETEDAALAVMTTTTAAATTPTIAEAADEKLGNEEEDEAKGRWK